MEKTSWDTAYKIKAVPPKIPDPHYQKGTTEPRFSHKSVARQYLPNGRGNPVTRERPPEYRNGFSDQVARKATVSSPDYFGVQKTLETLNN